MDVLTNFALVTIKPTLRDGVAFEDIPWVIRWIHGLMFSLEAPGNDTTHTYTP